MIPNELTLIRRGSCQNCKCKLNYNAMEEDDYFRFCDDCKDEDYFSI